MPSSPGPFAPRSSPCVVEEGPLSPRGPEGPKLSEDQPAWPELGAARRRPAGHLHLVQTCALCKLGNQHQLLRSEGATKPENTKPEYASGTVEVAPQELTDHKTLTSVGGAHGAYYTLADTGLGAAPVWPGSARPPSASPEAQLLGQEDPWLPPLGDSGGGNERRQGCIPVSPCVAQVAGRTQRTGRSMWHRAALWEPGGGHPVGRRAPKFPRTCLRGPPRVQPVVAQLGTCTWSPLLPCATSHPAASCSARSLWIPDVPVVVQDHLVCLTRWDTQRHFSEAIHHRHPHLCCGLCVLTHHHPHHHQLQHSHSPFAN
ncbi:uncharacterized protein LOC141576741 [Camelus bactrianus]|uniref:Uncharacterized protein LOC141576741 n=1 Tax=Camelus bactrianus TaxID=9837 RepID=A0AC58Q1U7_CAMBA